MQDFRTAWVGPKDGSEKERTCPSCVNDRRTGSVVTELVGVLERFLEK